MGTMPSPREISAMFDKLTFTPGTPHPVFDSAAISLMGLGFTGSISTDIALALPAIFYSIQIWESKTLRAIRAWVCSLFRRAP